MGIALTDEEVWAFVAPAHTGVFTTLRPDGHPVPVPVWFVVLDHAVYVRAIATTHKVAHVRHDPRASFLVEDGAGWRELRAVLMLGTARVVDDHAALVDRVAEATRAKYEDFRSFNGSLPQVTRSHYNSGSATMRFVPTETTVSWDNRKIRTPERSG